MPDQMDFDLRTTDGGERTGRADSPKAPDGAGDRHRTPGIRGRPRDLLHIWPNRCTGRDQAAAPPVVQPKPESAAPLGAAAEPIDVPALDESDPLVRELVGKLSSHPGVAAWLATDGLVRNFTVVVANIAEGRTPAGHLRSLAPSGSFRIIERNEESVHRSEKLRALRSDRRRGGVD